MLATEEQEQCALIEWVDIARFPMINGYPIHSGFIGDYLFHVPNGKLRHIKVALQLKKMGLRPGIPDLFFAFPYNSKPGLFIEMKRKKKSGSSDNQRIMINRFREFYPVKICQGFEEARDAILNYLSIPTT